MTLPVTPTVPTGRRRLTQKKAAFALAALMLAVPGIPMLLSALVPEREWHVAAPGSDEVEIVSAAGHGVLVTAPPGWETRDDGHTMALRSGGATVVVQVYDRGERDPDAVAQRLIRSNRVAGWTSALDGGRIASADGGLTGDTCVVVAESRTGTCAFLADDDVVVSVLALGDAENPAPSIAEIVAPLTRSQP
ncbi:hypothetical protein [Mycolicibacterium confluentis]|uniref:Uncharacterized protein n=1 Tax=Mycolicibacterium confluentis TaxID=28047 RepID=A0A7I7XY12_9MYCO|nr:hypothetical protein [Mycolicibacterium confluentis]MCV7322019.1 hypothetical protein [Mycolicibacterium confluentis]ORV32254.1 hypothetical protein AWB99_11495 [Mycolicibacterium confluentis]BBZ33843.1 hypothetical protein MCNF_24480 [Mycolicibacterium confluentis]